MRDWDIRNALARLLREEHPNRAQNRIWSEFSVRLGASRVDLCLINGSLTGFEIKSPRDNLDRIDSQVSHYGAVLDYAAVVCGEHRVDRLLDRLPGWWGVTVAEPLGDEIRLHDVRLRSRNSEVDALSVAQLLWRDEAMEVLRGMDAHRGLSKATRWGVWDRLVESCSLIELQDHVRVTLKRRPLRPTDEALALDGAM